jgi:hypothetical protein
MEYWLQYPPLQYSTTPILPAPRLARNEKFGLVFDPAMEYVRRMNWVEKPVLFGLGGILVAVMGRADVTEPPANPYQVILDRNPFGLKPAPALPVGPTNPVEQVNVKLTGFTSDSPGSWKAWLMIPARPGGNPNPQYLSLAEHEKQGDIEVVEINEKESTVKILNGGTQVELNIKDHGLPTPPSAPLLPAGPPHPLPGVGPTPGIVPATGTPGFKTAGATPGTPGYDANMAARYGMQPSTATANPAVRTIPTRNVRTSPMVPQAQNTAAPIDPAVQRIMMEAQRAQAEKQGIPYPPLPPVPGQTGR